MVKPSPEESIEEIIALRDTLTSSDGANEAATRLVLINRVLTDVLGWKVEDLNPEQYLPGTDETQKAVREWLDYHAIDANGSRLVVEAKRIGATFDLPAARKPRRVSLKSLQSNAGARIAEAIRQVLSYSIKVGTSCFVVSNGNQWVASASFVEGIPVDEMNAIVFYSLEDVRDNLTLFAESLSPIGISQQKIFQQVVDGLSLRPDFAKCINDELRPNAPENQNYLAAPLERLMSICFGEMVDLNHQKMLEDCYVSLDAANSDVMQLETFIGNTLPYELRAPPLSRERELDAASPDDVFLMGEQKGESILVVGRAGSGKSTFLAILKQRLQRRYGKDGWVLLHIDLRNRTQIGTSRFDHDRMIESVCKDILTKAETEYSEFNPFANENLREIFAGEIRRFKASLSAASREAPDFERRVDDLILKHLEDAESHLKAFLGFLGRRNVPATVFLDNVDRGTVEFERVVFQLAQNLNQNTNATIVTTLRDTTFFNAKNAGFLDVARHAQFTISPPPFTKVVERRLAYARQRFRGDNSLYAQFAIAARGTPVERVFEFVEMMAEMVLGQGGEVSECIQNIAGTNVRTALDLLTDFAISPHTNLNRLFADYRARRLLQPLDSFLNSLMRGKNMRYTEQRSRILDVFQASRFHRISHLVSIRILQFLLHRAEARQEDRDIRVGDLVTAAGVAGFPVGILEVINHLGKFGLLNSRTKAEGPWGADDLVEIGTAGSYYLTRLLKTNAYLQNVVDDVVIYDSRVLHSLLEVQRRLGVSWSDKHKLKLQALLAYLWDIERDDPLKLSGSSKVIEDVARSRFGNPFVRDLEHRKTSDNRN